MCFKEGIAAQSALLISRPQAESRGIQGRVGKAMRGKIVAPTATQTLFSEGASLGVKGAGGGSEDKQRPLNAFCVAAPCSHRSRWGPFSVSDPRAISKGNPSRASRFPSALPVVTR